MNLLCRSNKLYRVLIHSPAFIHRLVLPWSGTNRQSALFAFRPLNFSSPLSIEDPRLCLSLTTVTSSLPKDPVKPPQDGGAHLGNFKSSFNLPISFFQPGKGPGSFKLPIHHHPSRAYPIWTTPIGRSLYIPIDWRHLLLISIAQSPTCLT
jgi:hypothetical protein